MKKYICILLTFILCFSFSINGYCASSTGGGHADKWENWTPEERKLWYQTNLIGLIATGSGIWQGNLEPSDFERFWSTQALATSYPHYVDFLDEHILGRSEVKDNKIYNYYSYDNDVMNLFSDYKDYYNSEHSIGYSIQYVYPIENVDPNIFPTLDKRNELIAFCHSISDDFIFFKRGSGGGAGKLDGSGNINAYYWLLKARNRLDFVSNGHLANHIYFSGDTVSTYVNWNNSADSNYLCYAYTNNFAQSYAMRDYYIGRDNRYAKNCNTSVNNTLPAQESPYYVYGLFSCTGKTEEIYVFDNVTSMKSFDSGVPQQYYMTEPITTSNTWYDTQTLNNVGNTYNNIVENMSSGLSPSEIQNIVNVTVNNDYGQDIPDSSRPDAPGGGGSDSGDDDNTGIWGSIGESIGKLFSSIADFLLGLINGILSKISDLIDSLTSIFENLINLVSAPFNLLMSGLFSWLPEELTALIVGFFGVVVLLGVVKLVKGLF